MTKEKITHPITRAALGIAALILIAIFANWLVALVPTGSRGADFTENKVHTLSEGTGAILGDLEAPVTIRYYATRKSETMPRELKLYMRRVDDLLREYQSLTKGKLRIEYLDPQPDTDAEDAANLDGISGQRINEDENLFLGIAFSCLDRTTTIPFLDPNDETMLEYQLSRSIAEVSRADKPVIGLMTALPLSGGPPSMPGQQPAREWVIHQQIKQSFEVRDVGMEPAAIDPEIDVLLLLHPANITPAAEFAIDQYLLKGGTVIACVDAFSIAAQMTGGGNPMMGGGLPTTSTLPTLLGAWGVNFESGNVVADAKYRTRLNDGRIGVGLLSLPKDAMPQKDNVITRDLVDLYFILPGGFTKTGGGGVAANTLVKSSEEAAPVNAFQASQLDQSLLTSMRPDGTAYDFVMHLNGRFKSAFPKGKPGEETTGEQKDESAKTDSPDPAKKDAKPDEKKDDQPKWLTEAGADGNVFLISDVDFLFDNFAYRVQNLGGMQLAAPSNGNSSLLLNLLDQATGSKHLIGARSRASARRPFTVIQQMEADFEQEVGRKIKELEDKQKDAVSKLNELQSQKSRGSELYLTPEQESEIRKLRAQQVSYSRQIREEQKELKSRKNRLATWITALNVLAVPVCVIFAGLGAYLSRRSSTRAR
jgi:ABC-type uncharacterized transport system involved in gliding motility auxiliary subunit